MISLVQFTKLNGNSLIQFLDQLYQCFYSKRTIWCAPDILKTENVSYLSLLKKVILISDSSKALLSSYVNFKGEFSASKCHSPNIATTLCFSFAFPISFAGLETPCFWQLGPRYYLTPVCFKVVQSNHVKHLDLWKTVLHNSMRWSIRSSLGSNDKDPIQFALTFLSFYVSVYSEYCHLQNSSSLLTYKPWFLQ